MYASIKALFAPIRRKEWDTIGADYTVLGEAISHIARLVNFDNLTNSTLMISHDGVNDHIVLPARSGKVFDIATNTSVTTGTGRFGSPIHLQWFVKYIDGAPTTGACYLTVLYGDKE